MRLNTKFLPFIILLAGLLAACGGRNSSQTNSSNYDISVDAESTNLGQTNLMVTVRDESDEPINDATVNIKGDMTHAGMQPVLGETSTANDGVYVIPYEWTMAGDWFVTIDVTFADGTSATERVDFNGIGDGSMDMEDGEMDHGDMDMDSDE
ncbi:MAG: FixH family protein [Anaerolineae bacterium]